MRKRIGELEKKLMEQTQEFSMVESMLALRTSELEALQGSLKELEELREMKEVKERKTERNINVF